MGQVCAKHEQFYEIECPYCERATPAGLQAAMPARSIFGIDPKPPRHLGPPPPPWPATLNFIPPSFRFVDAKTGKPVPLVGKHFRAPDRDACALCGMSGMQILQDPTIDCNPPPAAPLLNVEALKAAGVYDVPIVVHAPTPPFGAHALALIEERMRLAQSLANGSGWPERGDKAF